MTNRTCAFGECRNQAVHRGWCSAHYQRWLRWGDPAGKRASLIEQGLSAEEKFWRHTEVSIGCWVWTGTRTDDGYGLLHYTEGGEAVQVVSHRFAYELLTGPIPNGLVLDHLCRNPSCVNPSHLEPVTQRENILRGVGPTAINARKTHCKRGHEFTPENTYRSKKGRECRACLSIRKAAYDQRKRAMRSTS